MGWEKNVRVCFKCEWPLAGFFFGLQNFSSCHRESQDTSFFLDNRLAGTAPKHFYGYFWVVRGSLFGFVFNITFWAKYTDTHYYFKQNKYFYLKISFVIWSEERKKKMMKEHSPI